MSFITDEAGSKKWDINSELTDEERQLVDKAGLTVPELRDFWTRFPEQSIEAAVGGCVMEKGKTKEQKG